MLPRLASVLGILAVALAAAGCGTATATAEQELSLLSVWERLPPTPMHTEGSLSFLRIERARGEVVVDGAMTDGTEERGRRPLFEKELAPGLYRIHSFQRPCAGSCEYLDPPSNECSTELRLEPGQDVRVTVVLGARDACRLEIKPRPS